MWYPKLAILSLNEKNTNRIRNVVQAMTERNKKELFASARVEKYLSGKCA